MDEALETRTGLPDALRVLLAEYPREAWETHDNFGALIRFWLDRHLMFRRLLGHLTEEAEGLADRRMAPMAYGRSMFVGELHGHHSIEDMHYFPQLVTLESRLEHGFEILDHDHKDLDVHLETFTNEANALLGAIGQNADWRGVGETMRRGLGRMEKFLDRHLTDEEDLVVPVLLKHAPDGLT